MLSFTDEALALVCIAACRVRPEERSRWLRTLADRLDPSPAPSKAAKRQRVHRARVKAGRMVLRIAVDDVTVPTALVEARLLDETDCDDREALTAAVERLLMLFSTENVTHNAADFSDGVSVLKLWRHR